MKFKFLPFLVIFLFIAASIFGFLYMAGMTNSECPLFQMLGGSCSPNTNVLVLISHHLAGFKTLSSIFISLSIFALLFFLSLASLSVFSLVFLPDKFYFNFKPDNYIEFNPIEDLISWLSLLFLGEEAFLSCLPV